jgi:hypothetical protein
LGAKSFVVGNLQQEIMTQKLGASNDDGDGKPPMITSHRKKKKLQS